MPLRRTPRRTALAVLIACAASTLAACSTMPPYSRPTVAVPQHYADMPGWRLAAPADALPRQDWWTVFDDTVLDQLEARVDISNQTVLKAVAQLKQERAMVDYQQAGFFPTLGAGAAQSRTRTSQDLLYHAAAGKTVPDYAIGLDAAWEPDLFGRIRAASANAKANAEASAADLASVRLSADADLAADYFELRSFDRQKQLLDGMVQADAAAVKLLQGRLRYGAADDLAIDQAQALLDSAQVRDTDIDARRAQLQHAIAVLIGVPASGFTLAPDTSAAAPPPAVPVGLPAQLLERRPDIAAAERKVAAANANIGEARAAFYPDLTLAADVGFESSAFGPWLTAPNLFWSLGPQLVGTLFDGGRHRASLRGADARYDGAVADYRQTVLSAFAQVEDGLSSLHTLADEAQTQARATDAAQRALQLAGNRYRAGAVDYLAVVSTQIAALQNQLDEEQIATKRMVASVMLIKAIGGGWQAGDTAMTSEHPPLDVATTDTMQFSRKGNAE